MDKQKQIEEMAKDMLNYAMEYYPKDMSAFTETTLREHFYLLYLGYAQYLIKAGYRKIPELPKDTVLTADDIAELLAIVAQDTRKEMAEKFAEKLKEKADYMDSYSCGKKGVFIKDIDETCKEFTEGKYGESLCEE